VFCALSSINVSHEEEKFCHSSLYVI